MSQDIKPGWYWAKHRKTPEAKWEVVHVVWCSHRGALEVWCTEFEFPFPVYEFEIGPRIEEPPP